MGEKSTCFSRCSWIVKPSSYVGFEVHGDGEPHLRKSWNQVPVVSFGVTTIGSYILMQNCGRFFRTSWMIWNLNSQKKQPKILNVWCRISSLNCFILCAIFLWNCPGRILNPKTHCQPASAQPNFKTLHSYAIFIDSFPSTKPTCIKVDDETLAGFQCHIHFGSWSKTWLERRCAAHPASYSATTPAWDDVLEIEGVNTDGWSIWKYGWS